MSDWNASGDGGWGVGAATEWKDDGPSATGFGSDNANDNTGFNTAGNDGFGGSGGGGGGCHNCGLDGHYSRECPNPKVDRPFTGTCRICSREGHRASDCPEKVPIVCRICQGDHKAADCTANRIINYDHVPDVSTEEAWENMVLASKDKDLIDFKAAVQMYCKQNREITYDQLERKFREAGFTVYLVALKKEIPLTMTSVNLQGKSGCEFIVHYVFETKPKRAKTAEAFPNDPEENMARLLNAGILMEHPKPLCRNCEQLGHISKHCPQEKVERSRVEIVCYNCNGSGHRQRDCPEPRQVRGACKNCGQSGHKAIECSEPRSAANVECRKCSQLGHFSKDCPNGGGDDRACRNCLAEGHLSKDCDQPRNPDNVTCRNCEKVGHFSRNCDQPKDWSKVQCKNCSEYGHTVRRCKAPGGDLGEPAADGGFGGDAGFAAETTAGGEDWNTGNTTGGDDWNAGATTTTSGGW